MGGGLKTRTLQQVKTTCTWPTNTACGLVRRGCCSKGLLAGQRFRLFRPPPSHLARNHHQPHATVPALELWISLLFVSPRSSQGDAVCAVRISRSHAEPTPKWRPKPTGCRRKETNLQQQRPIFFHRLKCALVQIQIVETHAPTFPAHCAAAFSTANPLRLKTPTGKRRKRTTRKGSESILETRWTGNAVNGTETSGPL